MKKLNTLFIDAEQRDFKKGELISTPNKSSTVVYQITKGFAVSYTKSRDEKRRIQTILKPYDIFPLLLTLNSTNKNVFIEALTNVSVQFIKKEIFLHEVSKNIDVAHSLIEILAGYLSIYFDRLENLEYDTVQKKVVSRILFFAGRFGKKQKNKIILEIPLTHQLIAESINVSRENVTRELNLLEKEKILDFDNHLLTISNLIKLKKKI